MKRFVLTVRPQRRIPEARLRALHQEGQLSVQLLSGHTKERSPAGRLEQSGQSEGSGRVDYRGWTELLQ